MYLKEKLEPLIEAPTVPYFTLEHIYQWLQGQDPNTPFYFGKTLNCLLAKYTFAHQGVCEGDHYTIGNACLPINDWPDGGMLQVAIQDPQTFGGAAERARRILANII